MGVDQSESATRVNRLPPNGNGNGNGGGRAVTVAPKRVPMPAEPFDRVKVFGGLLLCLLVCAVPLVVGLGEQDVASSREARRLLTSRETWLRWHDGQKLAWMIPSHGLEQAVDPPPMTTWLHMLAWTGVDPATAGPSELALRARYVSIAMALLALMATYWAGVSIGGAKVGRMATLAMGTTVLLMYEVRFATLDAVLLGFTALSVAAGLWAMRPLKDINWVGRRVIGWLLAGAALAGAILTAGPVALGFVLPPLLATIALTPMRRVSNTTGLVFAVVLGLLGAAPWYLYVLEQVPDAQEKLFGSLGVPRDLFVLTWSHLRLLLLLSPWIVWLVGALCQPFMRADRARRRQLLIAWFWFVLTFVALSIPAAQHPRYLLPVMPAVGLMVGQLWAYHAFLAGQRQLDPGVNLLRVPHWLGIGLASILGPTFIALQPTLVERGWLESVELPGIDWPAALGIGVVLLTIALAGTRWHFKWRPRLAAYATTAWMVVAAAVAFYSHSRSEHQTNPQRPDAERLAAVTAPHPVGQLVGSEQDEPLSDAFVFYLGRQPAPVAADQLDAPAAAPRYVIARTDTASAQRLDAAGYRTVLEFSDSSSQLRRLYRRPPAAPTPSAPDDPAG